LSIASYFGVILLIGLVARDSVLFIERIIQIREEGASVRESIMRARKERLRPILMTTITIYLPYTSFWKSSGLCVTELTPEL